MMTKAKPLPFTQKELGEILSYNPETGVFLWKTDRTRMKLAGKEAGFVSSHKKGYRSRRVSIGGRNYKLARLAWLLMTGDDPGYKFIDHINGDPLDNSWTNLRLVNNTENNRNMTISRRNTSGRTGVTWCKRENKWRAQMWFSGNGRHLGYFDSVEGAVAARKKAEKEYGFSERHGQGGSDDE